MRFTRREGESVTGVQSHRAIRESAFELPLKDVEETDVDLGREHLAGAAPGSDVRLEDLQTSFIGRSEHVVHYAVAPEVDWRTSLFAKQALTRGLKKRRDMDAEDGTDPLQRCD